MKRGFKGKGALEFLDILDGTFLGRQFLTYAEKRAHTPRVVEELITSASLQNEFVAKCQWIQQVVGKSEKTKMTMEHAALIVVDDKTISSVASFKAEIFNGFMHFIIANEKNPSVLNSLMTTWVSEGRTLVELDSNGLTPIQVAVYTNNVMSFAALAGKGVDVTAIDKDGLTPLHVIVNKIKDGTADTSLLHQWIESGLSTAMKSGEDAGKNAGKTAVEFAQEFGLIEVTKILEGDLDLSISKSDELFSNQKDLIIQMYYAKIASNSAMKLATAIDKNKLLLHYLIENYAEIHHEVFVKILTDKELEISINISVDGKTALQKCVDLGYNDWALALVRTGVGSVFLDNGVTVLNHCVSASNYKLLKMIEEDEALDLATFATAAKQYPISPSKSLPLTALLQAVSEGNIDMVVKLSKAGVGTTTLDNTNHVLNYVVNFAGARKIEMIKALTAAGIDVSNEKAEQALVSALHPEINAPLVAALISTGISTEGALKLFAENGLCPQIECLIMSGAKTTEEFDTLIKAKGLTEVVEKYITFKAL